VPRAAVMKSKQKKKQNNEMKSGWLMWPSEALSAVVSWNGIGEERKVS
jgi:hypothetical protein